MIFRVGCLVLAGLVLPTAADPHAERLWTGKNGETFRGAFTGTDKATGKLKFYQFTRNQGKSLLIDPNNISDTDRAWLELELHPEKKVTAEKPEVGDPSDFLADPKIDRDSLRAVEEPDFQSKESDSAATAVSTFLLWWDKLEYLPVEHSGKPEFKARQIHSRISRLFNSHNKAGYSLTGTERGIRNHFERDFEGTATVRTLIDYDCSVDNLRRYATGLKATLLQVSIDDGNKRNGRHFLALSHIEANGDLIFFSWGIRFKGQLKVLEENARLPKATTSHVAHKYELQISNREDLPEWAIGSRFLIDPKESDGLLVVAPYRYKDSGRIRPAPPDRVMQPDPPRSPRPPSTKNASALVGPILTPLPLPHVFNSPAEYSSEWHESSGRSITGSVLSCDDSVLVLNSRGRRKSIDISTLDTTSQARALFWRGIAGQDLNLTDGRFDYRLTRGEDLTYPVHIFLSKGRFRLELPFLDPIRTIVADTQTGAFHVYWDHEKHFIGKIAISSLLPDPPHGDFLNGWEILRDRILDSKVGSHPDWPCRMASWEKPEASDDFERRKENFRKPSLLFSGGDAPNLIAALRVLLSPKGVKFEKAENKKYGFNVMMGNTPSSGHDGAADALGFCLQSHLIPLRLEWTNLIFPESKNARFQKPMAGSFRLDLIKFDPTPQVDSLFDIPTATDSIEVDHCRTIPLK